MIKINLALRKQPSGATEGTKGTGATFNTFSLEKFKDARLDGLKELPIKKLALFITAIGLSWYFMDDWKATKLADLDTEISKLTAERARLSKMLEKTKELDVLKKALETDEALIRNKIETVQKLIQDRQTPPKLLLSLSSGMPAEVWISDFKIEKDEVTFHGSSLNFGQISDFMKTINESALFKDVKLVKTEQAKDNKTGMEIADFELQAKRRTQN
jgi:Tfp pilus assembly protein PilN